MFLFVYKIESTQADLKDMSSPGILVNNIESAEGSRPAAWLETITIPNKPCSKCVLAVLDQRQWGACIDLKVEGAV